MEKAKPPLPPDKKSAMRKFIERGTVALGIGLAGLKGADLNAQHQQAAKIEKMKIDDRRNAEEKIAELRRAIAGFNDASTVGQPEQGLTNREEMVNVMMERDKKLRDFFNKKYPDYELELDSIENGTAKYSIKFVIEGEEAAATAFEIEEDGGFTTQVPAYVDKEGRLGMRTTTFASDTDMYSILDTDLQILNYIKERGKPVEGVVDPKIVQMAEKAGYQLEKIDSVDDLNED